MTDEKTPVADNDNKAAKKKTSTKKPATHSKTGASHTGLHLLTLLIALASCGGVFYLWQSQQQTRIQNTLNSQSLEQLVTELKENSSEKNTQLETAISDLKNNQDNLHQNLVNLIKDNDHLRNDWLMAEAEYLIQLANHRLLLEKDVETAIVALKAANARLAEVADPALLSVRKILANDIQALNNVPRVDVAGLSVTLTALTNNITNLPLRTPDPESYKKLQEKTSESKNVENINELPAAIWKDIKNLIVIRNHQKPVEALLSPEQHFFLTQNLALLLEQTRLALLNGQNVIFHERLTTTDKWLKQFFDTNHNVTRNMLMSIEELMKFNIDPALPDISSTYSVIKKYRQQGNKPVSTSNQPAVK